MEILSLEFLSALVSLIIIDLVLAGDNALVIALAARNVSKELQRKVILWGTAGAIFIRAIMTLLVVWLLKIPGLIMIGGVVLLWISYKLLIDSKDHGDIKSQNNVWSAISSIVIADTVMGIDNVLAVAGAAHGEFLLVVLGLIISVPIVVWGSTFILKWLEKYPVILYIGSGILAWTAMGMIMKDINMLIAINDVVKLILTILITGIIVVVGYIKRINLKG